MRWIVFLGSILICIEANASSCARCDMYRKMHQESPGPEYEYYEDYLKAKKQANEDTSDSSDAAESN